MRIWTRYADDVVSAVHGALGRTPPELSEDILEDGITLTGGAAMTGLVAQRIEAATGIHTRVADAPLGSVARGLATMLHAEE